MIKAADIMSMLVAQGFATEAVMQTHKSGALRWKSPAVKSDQVRVRDETYGTKSFLYFTAKDETLARKIAKAIEDLGGKPDFTWMGGEHPECFDVQVSPFKGYHHWE